MERLNRLLQPALAITDDGLRLYRRNFGLFALLTAGAAVPVAIILGGSIVAQWDILSVLVLLTSIPLALYLLVGLSRATLLVQQDETPSVWQALQFAPLRLAGVGCYGLVFSLVINTVLSTMLIFCFCGIMFGGIAFLGGAFAAFESNDPVSIAFGFFTMFLIVILFLAIYVVSFLLNGIAYCSMIYAIQPFVQHDTPLSTSIQRSLSLLGYQFGQNLLVFTITSLLFIATTITVTLAIGTLLPLPLALLLGDQSPIVQGISVGAWISGLIVVAPLVPIWMTLLYQRNYAAYEGNDLALRIARSVGEGVYH